MQILIDTDVTLDFLLQRQPFAMNALDLWKLADQGRFDRWIAAITPINVFYIARKNHGLAAAQRSVDDLLQLVQVAPVHAEVLRAARNSVLTDFEDAVQVEAARAAQLDAIVTRNLADYVGAPLPVYSPTQLLALLTTSG